MTETSPPGSTTPCYLPIEDYGIIGDLHTVALVGKNGSIDWCCIPSFDAPSVFGAVLDSRHGGFFRICPHDMAGANQKQHYLPETNVLVTRFLTPDVVVEVTDFMAIEPSTTRIDRHRIMRSVHAVHGSLAVDLVCRPAFNYARDSHSLSLTSDRAMFSGQNLCLILRSSVPLRDSGDGAVNASFTVRQGESAYFVLESAATPAGDASGDCAAHYREALLQTQRYWRGWLRQCRYQGRWREMVHRSALVLKLLTYAPTGAIVAAPTTSLPEAIGGERNWDYRFTWLRDSAMTLHSLLLLGFAEEAEAFGKWLMARLAEWGQDGGPLQPMYTINGDRDMPELTLDHLEGYRGSRPVRIGNGAYTQQQLDVYGELLDAVWISQRRRGIYHDGWAYVSGSLTG